MSFQFSSDVDKNKIFLVQLSELEGRLDPIFYSCDLNEFISRRYKNLKIQDVTTKIISGTGVGKQDQSSEVGCVIQIRPTNIDKNGNLKYDKNIFLPKSFQGPKIHFNDILFNNTNSQELVGKTSILKENKELFFSNHITKIKVNTSKIIPDYLSIVLNMYQRNSIFYSICTNWNNQSGIGLNLLKSLKIPIPPKEIQSEIVAKMDTAYASKKCWEEEAQKLLGGIDDYLLGELGIELPEQTENTLQSRIFIRQLSEVSGGRFDPKLYNNITVALKRAVNNSYFPSTILRELIISNAAGDWGNELNNVDSSDANFSKCLVIRATEFDNAFNLKLDNTRVKYRLIKNSNLLKLDISENDLLIEKAGGSIDQPVGRVSILSEDIFSHKISICYSNFIQKIRVDNIQIQPNYLFCFLKTVHNIGLTDAMQSQTSGIRNLIMNYYFGQSIPLPPLAKQTEIANHITTIRKQAQQLQQQAKAELEQAKKEVEVMILGK